MTLSAAWRFRWWSWVIPLVIFVAAVGTLWFNVVSSANGFELLQSQVRSQERTLKALEQRRIRVSELVHTARRNRDGLGELYDRRLASQSERLTQVIQEVKALAARAGIQPPRIAYREQTIADFGLIEESLIFRVTGQLRPDPSVDQSARGVRGLPDPRRDRSARNRRLATRHRSVAVDALRRRGRAGIGRGSVMKLSSRERRLLVLLVIAVAALGVRMWLTSSSSGSLGRGSRGAGRLALDESAPTVSELRIADLERRTPRLDVGRNPFRYAPVREVKPPDPPKRNPRPPRQTRPAPTGPQVPRITLHYMGRFGSEEVTIAVFRDGDVIYNAMQGDVLDGKFIVDRVGFESADIKFVGFPDVPPTRLSVGG